MTERQLQVLLSKEHLSDKDKITIIGMTEIDDHTMDVTYEVNFTSTCLKFTATVDTRSKVVFSIILVEERQK